MSQHNHMYYVKSLPLHSLVDGGDAFLIGGGPLMYLASESGEDLDKAGWPSGEGFSPAHLIGGRPRHSHTGNTRTCHRTRLDRWSTPPARTAHSGVRRSTPSTANP